MKNFKMISNGVLAHVVVAFYARFTYVTGGVDIMGDPDEEQAMFQITNQEVELIKAAMLEHREEYYNDGETLAKIRGSEKPPDDWKHYQDFLMDDGQLSYSQWQKEDYYHVPTLLDSGIDCNYDSDNEPPIWQSDDYSWDACEAD